ncbi:hypothetical protein BCS98_04925 [Vibrio breoganii]|uniref:glycosyl transferase n=1 Tax=Vibrio breoganii TaxID=553239 RepID=UPI000C8427F5|nr:glycosyl transferase [Vibrio breoganii]PMO94263.1 hypothetical protein BCS98_04925 [Vibrio breoganii]
MLGKYIDKYRELKLKLDNIDKEILYNIKVDNFLRSALNSNIPLTKRKEAGENELIISATTYGNRIHSVYLAIESISTQTVKPHRLILWLDEKEFTYDDIPEVLKIQERRGLEIRFSPNYGSYKKLIPTLKNFPNADVICIDDDYIYPHDMVEILKKESRKYSGYIIGHRAHRIKWSEKGELLPYNLWDHEVIESNSDSSTFITTGGGTFFPAYCFNSEAINHDIFMSLCPFADDVWVKVMSVLSETKIKKVDDSRKFKDRFIEIKESKEVPLSDYNLKRGGNDIQLNKLLEKYGITLVDYS